MRSQTMVSAVPQRSETVAVAVSGSPQVSGPGESELPAALRRPPALRRADPRPGDGLAHHPVRPQPTQCLHRQVLHQVAPARGVVSGIEDDQDAPTPGFPPAATDEVLDDTADLNGGDLGDIALGAEADRLQQLAPGGAAGLRRDDEPVRPTGDHQVLVPAAAEGMAEQPLRAALGARNG